MNITRLVVIGGLAAVIAACSKTEISEPVKSTPAATPPPAVPPTPPRNPDDIPPPDDVKAPPADAQKTPSGLAYKVLKPGTGKDKPTPADSVEVHYTGWTTDGRMFDSSVKRGQPAKFPVGGVIKGWTEGLQLMDVGSTYILYIPSELAYGTSPPPRSKIPADSVLIFKVELISIKK